MVKAVWPLKLLCAIGVVVQLAPRLWALTLNEIVSAPLHVADNSDNAAEYEDALPGSLEAYTPHTDVRTRLEKEISATLSAQFGRKTNAKLMIKTKLLKNASEFNILRLKLNRSGQDFVAQVAFHTPRGPIRKDIQGHFVELVDVCALSRACHYGEVITPDMITTAALPVTRLSKYHVIKADDVVGKTPKRGFIKPNMPISSHDFAEVNLVAKGDTIKVLYNKDNLCLETDGVAQETGAKDKVIKVAVPHAKAPIFAKVKQRNIAEVVSHGP